MKKIRSVVPVVLVSLPVLLGAVVLSCGSYPWPTNGEVACATPGPGPAQPCTPDSSITTNLPCDVLAKACQACVAAHSTVRVIRTGYTSNLYQVQRASDNQTQDIGAIDGFADKPSQDSFCQGTQCTVSKIYDQSGNGNDLETLAAGLGGKKTTASLPAKATALPVTINGHSAYGLLFKPGMGYRTGCKGCNNNTGNVPAKGVATGDDPQTMYMVSCGTHDLVNGCCFDYGNAESDSHDDGNGTMEAVYLGLGVVWGTGSNGGPWVMADLENGVFAGWENGTWSNISTNQPVTYDFVTGVVVGDTAQRNCGRGRFAIYGGDATQGTLQTMWDGIRPTKPGYLPMAKQGSIILSTGGDNSDADGGRFYEGAMAPGAATLETVQALQASIVAANYGK